MYNHIRGKRIQYKGNKSYDGPTFAPDDCDDACNQPKGRCAKYGHNSHHYTTPTGVIATPSGSKEMHHWVRKQRRKQGDDIPARGHKCDSIKTLLWMLHLLIDLQIWKQVTLRVELSCHSRLG
jgi:hypothetical protein